MSRTFFTFDTIFLIFLRHTTYCVFCITVQLYIESSKTSFVKMHKNIHKNSYNTTILKRFYRLANSSCRFRNEANSFRSTTQMFFWKRTAFTLPIHTHMSKHRFFYIHPRLALTTNTKGGFKT